jgi:predicted lysophospholipase L1 biosynthesis ABC-type transport system permease subunit
MNENQQSLETLQDIKRMMERSSRFISLSGLSGISAGICALAGAWIARPYVFGTKDYIIIVTWQ